MSFAFMQCGTATVNNQHRLGDFDIWHPIYKISCDNDNSLLKVETMHVYRPILFLTVEWCITYFRHLSLLIVLRQTCNAGRERLAIVRDGTGTVLVLMSACGNGTGMNLFQWDGTGLVMIFIPVSLSIPHLMHGFLGPLAPAQMASRLVQPF